MSAATDAIGRCVFIGTLYELEVPSRDCHVASLLAMTRQGSAAMGTVRRTELAVLLPLRGRAWLSPPLQGQCGLNGGWYKSAMPSRDCTPRALPRASRSGRHVGLWPPRNDKPLVFAILMPARTSRRCLTGRRGRRPLQRPTDSLARLFPLHLLHSSSPNIAKNTPIRSDGGACI